MSRTEQKRGLAIAAAAAVFSAARSAAGLAVPVAGFAQRAKVPPADFEKAWRARALDFAGTLQPGLAESNKAILAESLATADPSPPGAFLGRIHEQQRFPAFVDDGAIAFYVAANGEPCDDKGNSGTSPASPFCTVERGVQGCRASEGTCSVLLEPGVHRLAETLVLGPQDSGLTIAADPARSNGSTAAILSGATALLNSQWQKVETIPGGVNGTNLTVWSTPYHSPTGDQVATLLVNGRRAIRARFPNADPEVDKFPNGFITSAEVTWLPPKNLGEPSYVQYNSSQYQRPTYRSLFQDFRGGIGGQCSVYDPPYSYWCAQNPQGGGASQYTTPSGISFDTPRSVLPNGPYKSPRGGVLAAWRPGHWANWAFTIGKYEANDFEVTVEFDKGGFQGGRGNARGAEWYVENIFEELDFPREFYHDAAAGVLYFVSGTASKSWDPTIQQSADPPAELVFEHSNLKVLVHARGTQAEPVKGVSLHGLTLTGTAMTFLDPHGVPSGGDWALQRTAAIFAEGVEGFSVTGCNLTHLDGNALMISGYSRNATIANNTFLSTGASAIALWGSTNGTDPKQPEGTGPDGTEGNFPRYTLVDANFITHLGIHEKQSSCFFQAKSAQSTLRNNICFDVPRAGFNFNDGLGGGNDIHHNLLFQTCGESGDHGAINTWDRVSYVTDVRNGTPSVVPATTTIHHNFIVADFDADGGMVDNDDGSSFYDIYSNFGVYGGAKMGNYDGHNKVCHNNVYAFPQVYGPACFWNWPGWFPIPGSEETFANNTCFLGAGENYIQMGKNCSMASVSSIPIHVSSNRVFAPELSNATVQGCGETITAQEWLSRAQSFDKGSTLALLPSTDEIVEAGMAVLKS